MLDLSWGPHLHVLFLVEKFEIFSLYQLEIFPVEATEKALVNEPHQEEKYACQWSKIAPETETDLAEVCGDASTTDSVPQEQHEVGGVAMDASHIVDFVTLGPRLLSIVEVHHATSYDSSDEHKERD